MLVAPGFRHQRGAAGPFAAHAEAEQDTKNCELDDVSRKATGRSEDSIDQYAPDKRLDATEAVRDDAEGQAAGSRRD